MNGQISLLNAISEKESQASSVERQTLPKSSNNAFALLMAGSHSTASASSSKPAVQSHNKSDKSTTDDSTKAVASDESNKSAEDKKTSDSRASKGQKTALDDVLPQLSMKDKPLTVSKEGAASKAAVTVGGETQSTDGASDTSTATDSSANVDTNVLANVPVQAEGEATLPSSGVASNTEGDVVNVLNPTESDSTASATVSSNVTAATSGAPVVSDSPHAIDAKAKADAQAVANPQEPVEKTDKSANASTVSSGTDVVQKAVGNPPSVVEDAVGVQKNAKDDKTGLTGDTKADSDASKVAVTPGRAHTVNKGVDTQNVSTDATQVGNAQASMSQTSDGTQASNSPVNNTQANNTNAPVTDKTQASVAAQYNGAKTVSVNTNASNNVASSTSDSSSNSSSAVSSQTGQQSTGQQNSSQSGQGQQSSPQHSFVNQFVQSQMQAQQAAAQQAAVKQFNDLSMSADTSSTDSAKLLGSLGFDSKGQLSAGLQGIAYSLRSPQWSQALGQRVVYMANNKIQEAKITLNPEKLGPVQIKLHLDKNQQMHVAMSAHHQTTKETMEAAIPKLKEMLDSAGIDMGSIDVNQDSQFEAQQQNEQDTQRGGTFGRTFASDDNEHDTAPVIVKQTNGLIDYYA